MDGDEDGIHMSECENCGGFVTDNYARVFGDNENRVHECRHCPPTATRSTDDDTDERRVLLRDVRGGDAGDDGAGGRDGPSTPGGASDDGEQTGATDADGTVESGRVDAPGADSDGPATGEQKTRSSTPATDGHGNRSGLSALLSTLRS